MISERTIQKDGWTLKIIFSNAGTRSEGQHGELHQNGRNQTPTHEGQEVETPLGRMKYYLYPENADLPFSITGWNYADRKLIRPSTFNPPPEPTPQEREALQRIVKSLRQFDELLHALDRGFEIEAKADMRREEGKIAQALAELRQEIVNRLPLLKTAVAAQKDISYRHYHYLNELTHLYPFLANGR